MQPTQTRTLRRILAVTTATALAVAAAIAAAPSSSAGGSGNFYKTRTCWVNTAKTANLHVTNYDMPYGQQYHFDMDNASGFKVRELYIDGVAVSDPDDAYISYFSRSSTHRFKAEWIVGNTILDKRASCVVTF